MRAAMVYGVRFVTVRSYVHVPSSCFVRTMPDPMVVVKSAGKQWRNKRADQACVARAAWTCFGRARYRNRVQTNTKTDGMLSRNRSADRCKTRMFEKKTHINDLYYGPSERLPAPSTLRAPLIKTMFVDTALNPRARRQHLRTRTKRDWSFFV